MAQIFGATISMLLLGTLIGWLLRKVSALSVLSSRLAGLVVLAFVAPAIYAFKFGPPLFRNVHPLRHRRAHRSCRLLLSEA